MRKISVALSAVALSLCGHGALAADSSAFDRLLKDSEFLADAAKMKIEINGPLPGVKINALLDRLYQISAATRSKLEALERGD